MNIKTTDLCDTYAAELQVAAPLLRHYGGTLAFGGPISTVKVLEDNVLVRAALEEPGAGRVLVIDGGGSLRCALLGDMLAELGVRNGWAGVVIHGCVRDTAALAQLPLGVCALASNPLRSSKLGQGQRDVEVTFAGVTFVPGHFLYADADGLIVAARALAESDANAG